MRHTTYMLSFVLLLSISAQTVGMHRSLLSAKYFTRSYKAPTHLQTYRLLSNELATSYMVYLNKLQQDGNMEQSKLSTIIREHLKIKRQDLDPVQKEKIQSKKIEDLVTLLDTITKELQHKKLVLEKIQDTIDSSKRYFNQDTHIHEVENIIKKDQLRNEEIKHDIITSYLQDYSLRKQLKEIKESI